MITEDKAKELAYLLSSRDTGSVYSKCKIITEWLEQNPIEPVVVVGLSDEQVRDLAGVVSSVDYDDFHTTRYDVLIQNYLKTQTFTQSEVKGVPVGLSDEQVDELSYLLEYVEWGYKGVINNYLKTQTFPQPQQFQPNWDDAPEWATSWDLQSRWYQDGEYITCKILKEEQRPKPAPKVEVREIWCYGDIECTVVDVTSAEVAIKNNYSSKLSVMDLFEFLHKFDCYVPTI